jgi:CRP-like cAMP-binding protein
MISPETLRRFSLFAGIEPAMLKEVAMAGEEVAYSAGEWIFHEGEEGKYLYLVLSGKLDLKIAMGSEEHPKYADVSSVVEGEAAGIAALLEPHNYSLSAVAVNDVKLAQLDGARLRSLMEENPEFGYKLMSRVAQVLSSRLNDMRVQLVSLAGD